MLRHRAVNDNGFWRLTRHHSGHPLPQDCATYSRWMSRCQSKTCVANRSARTDCRCGGIAPACRCAGRDDRSGAVPHDRSGRDGTSPAGRFLHAADLAGKQLPAACHEPARARRGWRNSCRVRRPSAGSPIRSIPSRRSRNRPSCLADLRGRFGNLGLAAAAYNGGPARVESLARGARRRFPERRATMSRRSPGAPRRNGRTWRAGLPVPTRRRMTPTRCLVLVAGFRRGTDRRVFEAYRGPIEESPIAPMGRAGRGQFLQGDRARELCAGA